MMLPGCAAIPAPHKERGQIAYLTGKRIVEMVKEDLKPSQIMRACNLLLMPSAAFAPSRRSSPKCTASRTRLSKWRPGKLARTRWVTS